ncbi:MAG: hypothetical protein DMG17_03565 [Acidobacteria bacterium]|nr:MAG: hypothetical protein DMG17_03565 [Acidobacteriota bacterium]
MRRAKTYLVIVGRKVHRNHWVWVLLLLSVWRYEAVGSGPSPSRGEGGPSILRTPPQDTQRTVWDGVYNDTQARRGEAVFLEACSNCHGRSLEGADMTPALTGGAFMANWDGLTVGDLFDRIRISMPADRPGSLSRQEDADVVAYILRFNEFPSGKEELPREVQILKQILFKASRQ